MTAWLAGKLIVYSKTGIMNDNRHNNDKQTTDNKGLQPDPETLHKTDPQENMEGPVSSLIKGTGDAFKSDESQEEADEKREEHM